MYLLNLIPPKPRNSIDDDPWQGPAKIHSFVHDKGHDTGCQDIVLHICVPRQPKSLGVVERDVVFGDLLERGPVGVLRHWWRHHCRIPSYD